MVKTRGLLLSTLVLIMVVGTASASVTIDFGTGDAGAAGTITKLVGNNASGSGIGVDAMTVVGDPGYNGVYDVIGTVNGSGELLVGSLDFNTTTNTITITGGITCGGLLAPTTACSAADILANKVLVVGGTPLLQGTGIFSSVVVSANGSTISVTFGDADQKAAALLTALGLPANLGFNLGAFTLGGQGPSPYTATSTDVLNTSVPEPTSILLLGTVMLGVTQLIRRRTSKA